MFRMPRRVEIVLLAALATTAQQASAADAPPLVMGDAGAAVRSDDATIDVDATLAQLAAMRCNTYLYDLPHGTDAWAKLPAFLDGAAKQGIRVYVYLAPWTLARHGGHNQSSQPYGTDFVKWSRAVGELGAKHANLAGIAMDDFAANANAPDHFTPESLGDMLAAGRAANPAFRFLPVLYPDGQWERFIERFGPQFGDGVILCYPRSATQVREILPYLRDESRGASLDVELPKHHRLKPGEGTYAGLRLDDETARLAGTLSFYLDDENATTKRGRHRIVVREDGRIAWQHEVASQSVDGRVTVPLRGLRRGSVIEVGLIADEPSDEAIVRARFADLRLEDARGRVLPDPGPWQDLLDDGISFTISPAVAGRRRWNIPVTLMVAGASFEDQKRFGELGTTQDIARHLSDAMRWSREGLANGVLLWFAPKNAEATLPAVVGKIYGAP